MFLFDGLKVPEGGTVGVGKVAEVAHGRRWVGVRLVVVLSLRRCLEGIFHFLEADEAAIVILVSKDFVW